MTEAEIGYQQAVAAGSPRYVSSAVTVAANWVIAGVFLFWAISRNGLPIDIGTSHAAHAIVRGLLGLLVIAVVRVRPVASGTAWVICLGFAALGIYAYFTKGSIAPLESWELVATVGYAVICPLAVWQTAVQAAERSRQVRASFAGTPRSTPTGAGTAIFGRVMANKIADLLERGETIVQGQREYCGTGLAFVHGRFVYDDMKEGRLACLAQEPPSFDQALAVFSERAAFVEWLAGQSDESLAGRREHRDPWSRTQRITLSRLRAAANDSSSHVA
jgi:hypothetical protein